ncbi:ShlB/FhaC/HecB family hemolysin secretion/activation protein [Sphingomonas montanisoli]|uniref:ShlB/FhaC/HecB family hemolysin secretion/activation protein n=1 Tax=Sphingomonas montanisoli TaxID=2606412 RepID=UPI001FED1B46|nr:ShlB/FhaC/HecB family hemolysin secretion/activation protein [Sphingomonas montanisoli]
MRNRFALIAGVGGLSLLTSPLAAQVTAPQLAPTREEVTRNQRGGEVPTKGSKLLVDGGIERAPCALDDPAYADIKVTITEAQFNNLQGVTPEELRPAYASALGQERPISTICTIRDAAATILRQKGYLAAVQVPVQRIENGVVKFEVLFAKIVAIRVRGDAGKQEAILARYLSKLTQDPVFNRLTAERYLLLARDVPGMDVRLSLKPAGTAPGELVGEVSVVRTPFDLDANVQNFAAKGTGRWSGLLRGQGYGLLTSGDRLSASVSSTADFKEQQIAQLGYDMRLGSEGVVLSGNLTSAWTKPDINTPGLSLKARTLFWTGGISYPIKRSQALSVAVAGGLDYLNQTVRLNGIVFSRDHLRVLYARLDTDFSDIQEGRPSRWRGSGSVELRRGISILNASESGPLGSFTDRTFTGRPLGDPTATVVRASGEFEINTGYNVWVAVMPRAQYAFDPLLSFEQFSTGNYSIGRGYDPGTTIGDSGIGASYEIRWNRITPFPRYNLVFQPFLFADVARTWVKDVGAIQGYHDTSISLGGGVHAALNNRFRIDATLAVPMRRTGFQTEKPDPRFLISLTTKLWPWSAR